jgi:hypothetical protein
MKMHFTYTALLITTGAALLVCCQTVGAQTTDKETTQSADEAAIKDVIRMETESYYARDEEAWQQKWLHDERATRTFVSNNSYGGAVGWSKFGPQQVEEFRRLKPFPLDLRSDNYIFRISGDLAWVEYDQYMNRKGGDPKQRRFSREYQAMVRQNGAWKIANQITHDSETFSPTPENLEYTLNSTGYNLLAGKK